MFSSMVKGFSAVHEAPGLMVSNGTTRTIITDQNTAKTKCKGLPAHRE